MFNLFRKKDEKVKKDDKVSTEYIEWRKYILNIQPTEQMKGIPDEVYGLLMDVGMGDGRDKFLAISIYAFNTGEASLKASPGRGVIGLGGVENIKGVPEKIVGVGQSLINFTKPAASLDYPEIGKVQFFFITISGIKVYVCNLNELQEGHPFNDIFNMFTQIKNASDKLIDEMDKNKDATQ